MGKTETGEGDCRGSLGITYTDNENACRSVKKLVCGLFCAVFELFSYKNIQKEKSDSTGNALVVR